MASCPSDSWGKDLASNFLAFWLVLACAKEFVGKTVGRLGLCGSTWLLTLGTKPGPCGEEVFVVEDPVLVIGGVFVEVRGDSMFVVVLVVEETATDIWDGGFVVEWCNDEVALNVKGGSAIMVVGVVIVVIMVVGAAVVVVVVIELAVVGVVVVVAGVIIVGVEVVNVMVETVEAIAVVGAVVATGVT